MSPGTRTAAAVNVAAGTLGAVMYIGGGALVLILVIIILVLLLRRR